MDRATRARIDSLLHEARSWPGGQVPVSIDELARRYQLDPLMVHRLLETEGIEVDETLELDPEEDTPQRGHNVTAVISDADLAAAKKAAGLDED